MANIDDDDDQSFIQRHAGLMFVIIIVLVSPVIIYAARKIMAGGSRVAARQDDIVVRLPPPPPPPKPVPTPTPEQQPTPEEQPKMVEQQPVQDDKKPEPPKDKPPESLGTSITGPGGVDMGLSGGSGGGGYGGTGGGGSKYGWYASEVQSSIVGAVKKNPATRKASMKITVRIWPDSTGRITKARVSSTGDAKLDAALQDEVLTGLQLADPPPADMPLPIVMRLTARRP